MKEGYCPECGMKRYLKKQLGGQLICDNCYEFIMKDDFGDGWSRYQSRQFRKYKKNQRNR